MEVNSSRVQGGAGQVGGYSSCGPGWGSGHRTLQDRGGCWNLAVGLAKPLVGWARCIPLRTSIV